MWIFISQAFNSTTDRNLICMYCNAGDGEDHEQQNLVFNDFFPTFFDVSYAQDGNCIRKVNSKFFFIKRAGELHIFVFREEHCSF